MTTGATLCQNELRPGRICHELLRLARMPDGSTRMLCQRCNWREAGRCWQCGGVRQNDLKLGLYCPACARVIRYRQNREWVQRNPEKKRAYDAKRWASGQAQPARPRGRPRKIVNPDA